jgi:hypothetical protein
MNCQEWRHALRSEDDPTTLFEGHLTTCADCQAWLDEQVRFAPPGFCPPVPEPLPLRLQTMSDFDPQAAARNDRLVEPKEVLPSNPGSSSHSGPGDEEGWLDRYFAGLNWGLALGFVLVVVALFQNPEAPETPLPTGSLTAEQVSFSFLADRPGMKSLTFLPGTDGWQHRNTAVQTPDIRYSFTEAPSWNSLEERSPFSFLEQEKEVVWSHTETGSM